MSNAAHRSSRLSKGVPNQCTMELCPSSVQGRRRSGGSCARGPWRLGRMTLEGAARYEHAWSYFPEQEVGAVRFLPTPFTYQAQAGVIGYDDITPRFGVAYDVFCNGKTTMKANAGKYIPAATNHNPYAASNPTART